MKNSKFKLFFLGAVLLLSVSAAAVFYEFDKEQTITLGITLIAVGTFPTAREPK